jgi:hypothetical protein
VESRVEREKGPEVKIKIKTTSSPSKASIIS